MSEKIICNAEDLVAIADAVRASTGGADTYTVPELSVAAVSAIGSGGGEDVTAETETYTDLLTDLEAAVDALPDAGSGGGASIETCTVVVNTDTQGGVTATTFVDGVFESVDAHYFDEEKLTFTIENVVCGSCVTVADSISSGIVGITTDNAEQMRINTAAGIGVTGRYPVHGFKITAPAGGTATITIYDDD